MSVSALSVFARLSVSFLSVGLGRRGGLRLAIVLLVGIPSQMQRFCTQLANYGDDIYIAFASMRLPKTM